MGVRVYDPDTGTFTQPDPIQGGGANAYGYTDGDPVNETDLSGESVVFDECYRDGNCYANGTPKAGPTLNDYLDVLSLAVFPVFGGEEAGAEVVAPLVRTEAKNLSEQLTLDEAKAGAGSRIMEVSGPLLFGPVGVLVLRLVGVLMRGVGFDGGSAAFFA
jgi:uncharacterized protein RhaS with RHS repeats